MDKQKQAYPVPGGFVENVLQAKASLIRAGYLPNADGCYHYVYSADELKKIKAELPQYPGSTLDVNSLPRNGIFMMAGIKMMPKLAGYDRTGFYIDAESAKTAQEIDNAFGFHAQIAGETKAGVKQFFLDMIKKMKEGKKP